MKIKNIVVYSSLFFSTATWVIVNHMDARIESKQNQIAFLENEIEEVKNENLKLQEELDNVTFDDIIGKIMEDLQRECELLNVNITLKESELNISVYSEKNDTPYELSELFYSQLNQIIILCNVNSLSLYSLENEIDFSKINLSNIKELCLYRCSENLDCSAFTQTYDSILFYNTSVMTAINLLEKRDLSETVISCSNMCDSMDDLDLFMDIEYFVNYLVENNICMKELSIKQWSYFKGDIALSKEVIETLGQVNTTSLSLLNSNSIEPISLHLKLNDKIKNLYLGLPSYVHSWLSDVSFRKVDDIKIDSNNPDLMVTFSYLEITPDTYFDISSSSLSLVNVGYEDIAPFYNFSNMKNISYETSTYIFPIDTYIVYDSTTETFEQFIQKMKEFFNPEKTYVNKIDK